MIGIIIAVLAAALVYWLLTPLLGLPYIIGVIAAILVLLVGIPTGGYGIGARFGGTRTPPP